MSESGDVLEMRVQTDNIDVEALMKLSVLSFVY